MRMYMSAFRIRFLNRMQYRTVALGDIATRFAWGLMEILAYVALYRVAGNTFPMNFSQTVSYFWMQQTLLALFSVVFEDGDICEAIRSGSIAYELVRPMNLYWRWFSQAAASRVSFTALNCLPALLLALVMPEPYRMSLPLGVGQFALFLLSTALALGVVVAFAMLMYVSLFYTTSHRGVKIIVTALTRFFSGGVIPLSFFPAQAFAIVRLLPFAAMQDMPLQIYNGSMVGADALQGVGLQILWLAILIGVGLLFMRRAVKKVVVHGG